MPKYNVLILADKKAKLISQLGLAENLKDEFNIFFLVAFEKKMGYFKFIRSECFTK